MLPFGKIRHVHGTQTQVLSRLMEGLEGAGCAVSRDGSDGLTVLIPGWDQGLLPFEALLSQFQQFFWDRMIVRVDQQGTATYRMVYWSGTQIFFHAVVTAIFALDVWFGASNLLDPRQFFLNFACAQLIPALLMLCSFHVSRRSALKRALV